MQYADDVITFTGLGRIYTIIRKNISHVSANSEYLSSYKVHLMNGEQILVDKSEYDKIKNILLGGE